MTLEVSARLGALICEVAAGRGASIDAICVEAGFVRTLGDDADAYVPATTIDALWDAAARATGDDAFGLHAAESLRPGMLDVVDYAVRTAPTLRTAYSRLVRYDRLVRDAGALRVTDDASLSRIEYDGRPGGQGSRHAAECKLAALVVIARQLTGVALPLRALTFRHRTPADVAEHMRVFGIAPRFGSARDGFEVRREALDVTCPGADAALWRVLERHADALLARRPDPTRTAERVRERLARTLADGEATLAGTAAALRMSERSLQRRLADEDTTFEAVLDDVRRELAHRYLRDRKIAIGEIAYLLGYSEPSAFHRAFKRWTGTTPSEARRSAA